MTLQFRFGAIETFKLRNILLWRSLRGYFSLFFNFKIPRLMRRIK